MKFLISSSKTVPPTFQIHRKTALWSYFLQHGGKNDRQHNLGFNGGFTDRYSPKHTEKYMVFLCLAHRRYFVVHSRFHVRNLWQSTSRFRTSDSRRLRNNFLEKAKIVD